ncbi:MAG: DUF4407 domain-containing protein [Flammeovirgaceae bacterium]|nr:DUF4407 domain-containing protein [Flammeovirgaceae bacterium]
MIFWLCSGADRKLLEQCPTESSKYVGIGATIFFTGIFAFLAGAYALQTVFNNLWIAGPLGFVWGLMIFNLDRYIVSSMRKEKTSWREWKTATPRLLLAILISIVIAKPLEMKIFEKEINAELKIMEQQTISLQEQEIKSRFVPERERLNEEIGSLKNEIDQKTTVRDDLDRIAREEADGTGGTMRKNAGPIYKIKKNDADKADQELKDLEIKYGLLIQEKLTALDGNQTRLQNELDALAHQALDGPAARLEALNRLTAKSDAVWWANWFVILLFIAVETAPVFVKLISSAGPYDHLLKSEEHGFDVNHLESIARENANKKKSNETLPDSEIQFLRDRLDVRLNRS